MSRLEKVLAALAVLPFGLGFTASESRPGAEVVFSFADPEIVESSGLAVQNGLFATVNDSGDVGRVFTVDPADGSTVAVTSWDGEPEDVEAMSLLPGGDVLVGDIGDNLAQRDSVEVLRMPFGEDGSVDPATYELTYPDGPHDAEALLVHPGTGQVLVVAKEFIGRIYAAPKRLDPDRPNRMRLLGEVRPIATDGAFLPDGEAFVLRGYDTATFYRWPSLEEVGEIPLPDQEQGEGIAVDRDGAVFVSSEGQHSEVLRIALPRWLRSALEPKDPPGDGSGEGPTTDDGDPVTATDRDEPAEEIERPFWPWAVGGIVGVVVILVLVRALRPR
ncbi:SMP-30/gluconolactonase/LRE family protein [Nocardioides bizhenqiangii]|uniref:WD40 repeat domain-containing protein n=1 Tax=Nocardioides bizhenqiangii TaxID=3095076 RepID=A0ABZ0ZS02_9ACTN|nr:MULTISPECIES: hypothetical protein [unclassified Nocardioides]MDZ5622822.1 hypothetical protein [Nocardioides sp. HM23]WQQ27082.1 hypothetical protein SHK19_02375 [Nocardioides sp. HM61]